MPNSLNSLTNIVPNKLPYAYRRDLPWSLDLDYNGDLKMVEDIDAVNQSIFSILSSNFGDKPLEEYFGSNAAELLFEHSTPANFMAYELQRRLETAIKQDEPGVVILKTEVDLNSIDRNIIRVTITYQLSDGISVGIFDENLSVFRKKV